MKIENASSQSAIDVTKDEKSVTVDVVGGYKHVPDGTIYFRLYDNEDTKYETPLGEVAVTKNTVEPTVAKASVARKDTDNATFKATRYGGSEEKEKATTLYYCAVADSNIQGDTNDAVTWNPKEKKFSKYGTGAKGEFTPDTRKVTVSGDSIETVIEGLNNTNGYRIYYVVENSYGSQTELAGGGITLPHIDLAKDSDTSTLEEKVASISTYPSDTTETNNKFKWGRPHSTSNTEHGYIVTLYKDGKIYYEDEVSTPETGFALKNYSNPTAALEAGEYYIEVVTKGNIIDSSKATVNSEALKSDVVTVKAIAPVSDIKLTTNETNGYPQLSWEENDANCGGYTVKLYIEDKDTGVYKKDARITSTTEDANNKSIYYATDKGKEEYQDEQWTGERKLDRNYGYYAEVVADINTTKTQKEIADNEDEKIIYVASQPEYYYFCAPYREAKITSASDSTMTFKLESLTTNTNYKKSPYNGTKCAYGEEESDLTYAVRVYKKINDQFKDMGTQEVKTTYEYSDEEKTEVSATYFTVSGLDAYTEYQFRLITKCGEFEGWSEVIANGHTMPRVENLTFAETKESCKENSNTFFYEKANAGQIMIDGKEYKGKDFQDTNLLNEFKGLRSFLEKLKSGDKVTITGDVVDLELNNKQADDTDDASFMYNEFLKGKILNITGTSFERKLGKLKDTSGTQNYPAEVHLKAGQFDLSTFTMQKDEVVTLGNGVKIKTGGTELGDLIVEAGAEVTVNNVKMQTDLQTAIKAKLEDKNPTLTIVANGEERNNLTFENLNNSVDGNKNDGNVTIKFVSSNGTETTQQGSITIKGKGGKVTVTQENVTVGSDIEVTVEKGEVDVTDKRLTGEKTVTLSAKSNDKPAKITAIAETAAPDELKGKTIVIKEYTVDTLRTALNGSSSGTGSNITEDLVKKVNDWLSKFEVDTVVTDDTEGVKVTVDSADGTKVTIENNSNEDVEISGLK